MQSKRTALILIIVLVAAIGLVAIKQVIPTGLTLKDFDPQATAGILAWLFIVALFVERAVEVLVMVLRDGEADQLKTDVDAEQAKIDELKKTTAQAPDTSAGLTQAQKALTAYRAVTKQIALSLGLLLGVLVSLAGVRALSAVVAAPSNHWLYIAMDVFITGAVLAGGSEGIHQMANVITNFLQATANKVQPST